MKINKIIFFLPRFHTNLLGNIDYLLKKKIKVKIFTLYKGKIENYTSIKPILIPQKQVNFFFFKLCIVNYVNLYRLIKKEKKCYAIIRLHNFQLNYLFPIFIKFFTNLSFYFYSQVNIKYYLNLKFFKKIKYLAYLNFFNSRIITPIFNLRKIINNKYFTTFPFVLKNHKQVILKKNYIKILSVGKFQIRKNHLLLIKALNNINYNYKLIIIGEKNNKEHAGEFKKIIRYIKKKNLTKKIKLIINLPNKKIYKYYNWCDFFVLPSTNEPAAISPLEAISYGKPSICSSNNGTKFYIKEEENGYIFRDNSLNSLRLKINLMCKNFKYLQNKLSKDKKRYLNQDIVNKILLRIFK